MNAAGPAPAGPRPDTAGGKTAAPAVPMPIEFQPIFDLGAWLIGRKRIVALEALARPPRRGNGGGSLREGGRLKLNVDAQLAALQAAVSRLSSLPRGASLAVNVSPEVVLSAGFADVLAGVSVDRIVLELSEYDAVADYEDFQEGLAGWRSQGLRLAIDDVGAGLTSLHHVLMVDPDVVKLDLDLVRGSDADPVRRALIGAVLNLVSPLDIKVVAEAIETPRELTTLVDLGVPFGQGYHLARPGPLAEADAAPLSDQAVVAPGAD